MVDKRLLFIGIFITCILVSSSFSAELSLEDIISKIQVNQTKIKDMYAETTTTITSDSNRISTNGEKPKKIVQKRKTWTKDKDKSKIEMLSPTRQITITNGNKMMIKNLDTGHKTIKELKRDSNLGNVDLDKVKEHLDLSMRKTENGGYIVTGVPKKENKFVKKMEFYIDPERWLLVKVLIYGPGEKLISQSDIEYQKISDAWVPKKNVSNVNSPMGKMNVETVFTLVKINEGIDDEVFRIDL